MAYAVVESGGKQYVARSGEMIDVDRLGMKEGEKVTFDNVLLVAGDGPAQVGSPLVSGAKVLGHVVEEFKGPKVIVFKYKPKIRYRKRQGHRQWYTRVAIDDVVALGKGKSTAEKAEDKSEAKAPKTATGAKAKQEPKAKASPKEGEQDKSVKAEASAKKPAASKKPATTAKKTTKATKKASGTSKDKKAD